MQIKNSLLLATALTAGSSVARLHGHERRHVHNDKRAVGDMVYATINGVLVSWINEWTGHAATAVSSGSQAEATTVPTTASASAPSTVSAVPTSPVTLTPGSCSDWKATRDDDNYSTEGFGERTYANGLEYIWYKGNVGNPWGSNIIEVDGSKACEYKHVVRIGGQHQKPWTIKFWNKMGPDGKLTGWYGHSALTIKLQPGETKYVAFDEDSQGAWGAAEGDELPTDQYGGYACTWGEFDFGNTHNNGWSGWDVSAIQAQFANLFVQGMRICDAEGQKCSAISSLAKSVLNAYTKAEEGVDGIGGNQISGPVRLLVDIDYNE
ncbi:allergen Asp f 4 [Aspergillus terreus]|uniref:Allergen Asp f 4 n=1 Tax=Aspergillus terreus TaxID=33178 RepID=A0A5M3ZBK1_ASPTE|nr:hypothetical protein ATETN484_0014001500 [Aspergillus terreus]GFF20681.1 allergen Asp f 4 [Aspergillus terreus]